jgi:hypothetical protein
MSADVMELIFEKQENIFYVWFSVHHKLIYTKNQRDATWQYVY